jgi:hypothetical protein
MRAIERPQRRHFPGKVFRRRLGEREPALDDARENFMLSRLRPEALCSLTGGDFSRRIASQNGQGDLVGCTTRMFRLRLAPAACSMIVFHASPADGINRRFSAKAWHSRRFPWSRSVSLGICVHRENRAADLRQGIDQPVADRVFTPPRRRTNPI